MRCLYLGFSRAHQEIYAILINLACQEQGGKLGFKQKHQEKNCIIGEVSSYLHGHEVHLRLYTVSLNESGTFGVLIVEVKYRIARET